MRPTSVDRGGATCSAEFTRCGCAHAISTYLRAIEWMLQNLFSAHASRRARLRLSPAVHQPQQLRARAPCAPVEPSPAKECGDSGVSGKSSLSSARAARIGVALQLAHAAGVDATTGTRKWKPDGVDLIARCENSHQHGALCIGIVTLQRSCVCFHISFSLRGRHCGREERRT